MEVEEKAKLPGRRESMFKTESKKRYLWLTRDIARAKSRDEYIQVNIKELLLFCVYLTFLSIAVLAMMTSTRFYYAQALAALFVQKSFSMGEVTLNFESISTKAEFFKYAETVMVEGFFWDFWYSQTDQVKPTGDNEKNILYENRMVGRPQIRQVRVRKESCQVPEIYRRRFGDCYHYYTVSSEDKSPFGEKTDAYTYKSGTDLKTGSYIGWISWYGGGGFAQILPPDRTKAIEMIKNLKEGLWVDRGTRAVFIDFTVYNPNINMFCIAKLVVEFPPQGVAIPSWSIHPTKFLRFADWTEYAIIACEGVIALMAIWYLLEEIQELYYFGWAYFTKFWNWMDLNCCLLRGLCIVLRIILYWEITASLEKLMDADQEYAGFEKLSWLQSTFHYSQAALLFFSWFTLFKYLAITHSVSRLHATISRCAMDLVGFVIIMFIALWTFGQVAYILFSHRLAEFRTWDIAIFTLIRILLGDYAYLNISAVGRILAPLFFLLYIFVVYFILMSMFLAIINAAYVQTKSDQISQGPQVGGTEMMHRGWRVLANCCGRKTAPPREYGVTKAPGLPFNKMRNVLRSSNFSDREIDQFFNKFDIRPDTVMTESAVKDMLAELEQPSKEMDPDLAGTPIVHSEYEVLKRRMADMEETISQIDERLTELLTQLRQG